MSPLFLNLATFKFHGVVNAFSFYKLGTHSLHVEQSFPWLIFQRWGPSFFFPYLYFLNNVLFYNTLTHKKLQKQHGSSHVPTSSYYLFFFFKILERVRAREGEGDADSPLSGETYVDGARSQDLEIVTPAKGRCSNDSHWATPEIILLLKHWGGSEGKP